jgi:hypothetical protein
MSAQLLNVIAGILLLLLRRLSMVWVSYFCGTHAINWGRAARKNPLDDLSNSGPAVRLVSGAAPHTRRLAALEAQRGPRSYIKVAALRWRPLNSQYLLHKENTMRFMMIMFPKVYQNAKPGWVPDLKSMDAMGKYNEELGKAGVLMPWGLARFHHSGQSRFVTCCCYHCPIRLLRCA